MAAHNCTNVRKSVKSHGTKLEKMRKELEALVEQWESRARRAFYDAEQERDPMGKMLMEHGAVCCINCAEDIKKVLKAVSRRQSATGEGDQR